MALRGLMLRNRLRIVTALVLVFILFVSFKILEPELRAGNADAVLLEVINEDTNRWEFTQRNPPELMGKITNSAVKTDTEQPDSEKLFVPPVGFVQQEMVNQAKEERKLQLTRKFLAMYDVSWQDSQLDAAALWQLADSWVTNRHIHADNEQLLGAVLHKLATAKIERATVGYKGSQLKLLLALEGGRPASFKPMWYPRDYVVTGKPYEGRDRHNAEIAAFHLQRLLGYNQAPIVVGRRVDLMQDIYSVADQVLRETFFTNGSDMCFYGRCPYCKSPSDGVCAQGTSMEGALFLWLPRDAHFSRWSSPWQRVYTSDQKARWEYEEDYCNSVVKPQSPFDSGPRLMDLIDAILLDYLISNADRHHYETLSGVNESMILLFDSAKSFGNPYKDEYSILAPLYQCCQLRRKTYEHLQELQNGVLSSVLRTILSRDPIDPVLEESHYEALDRRLRTIMYEIEKCVETRGEAAVIVDDYYGPVSLPQT